MQSTVFDKIYLPGPFSAPKKVNLGCTVNMFSGSPTVLKKVFNKKCKIKHVA